MPDESAYARLSAAVVAGDKAEVLAALEGALDAVTERAIIRV